MKEEYAIIHNYDPDVIHRGPFERLEDAQEWLSEWDEDCPEIPSSELFTIVCRQVSSWTPLHKRGE